MLVYEVWLMFHFYYRFYVFCFNVYCYATVYS